MRQLARHGQSLALSCVEAAWVLALLAVEPSEPTSDHRGGYRAKKVPLEVSGLLQRAVFASKRC